MFLKVYKSEKIAIGLVLAAVGGVGIVVGMSFPLLTLLMERQGFSASLIGLNSATGSLGILVVGLFTAKVLGRHGAFMPIIVAAILGTGSLIALPLVGHPAGWFILRFLLTVSIGLLWLLSESWLNMLTSDGNRGRIIGLYAVLFSAGFALGPLVVSVTGSRGLVPFAIAAVVMAGSAVPLLMLASRGASAQDAPVHQFALLMAAPFIFIVAFAGGLFETTAYALLPIYTLGEGLSENASLYALSAFSAGGIVMQYPLGRYADRAGRQALMVLSATGVLIGIIALPFVVENMAWLMALLFIWGGMVFGVYTAGLIMLGDEYPSESLVAVNALFIIFYEAGALVGPALSGAAMDNSPRHGFVSFLTVVAILLLTITVYRGFRRPK